MEPDILTIDGVSFTERELKQIGMAKSYAQDPFGTSNHLLLTTIAKLARLVEKKSEFKSDHWSSE